MIPLHDNNPTRILPLVTYFVIISCVLIFFWQLSLGPASKSIIYRFGVIPSALLEHQAIPTPAWATVVSSMFLHGGWMHLLGNMLYLWIFGNNIEDAMGHKRFILFYLLCGLAAALAQALPNPQSDLPMIGASGAISGVLGAYLMLYPHARVLVAIPFGFIVHTTRLPASIVLAFWFILQLVNSYFFGDQAGGVAWGAHIGGFLAGIVLIPFFKYKRVRFFTPKRKH